MASDVESLFEDYEGLVEDLRLRSPSGLAALNRSYPKHLLVAAASNLEDRVKKLVPEIFLRHGAVELSAFVTKQVMSRSYHTLFDWNNGSAQGFFRSFGDECAARFKQALKDDAEGFAGQHAAFMLLGRRRNEVVHNDYVNHSVELTPMEVVELYRDALRFTTRIESFIIPRP